MKSPLKEECHWDLFFWLSDVWTVCVLSFQAQIKIPGRGGWEGYKEILHSPAYFSATSLNGICSRVMQCCHGCCATPSPLPVNGELCLLVLRQYFYVISTIVRIKNLIFWREKKKEAKMLFVTSPVPLTKMWMSVTWKNEGIRIGAKSYFWYHARSWWGFCCFSCLWGANHAFFRRQERLVPWSPALFKFPAVPL